MDYRFNQFNASDFSSAFFDNLIHSLEPDPLLAQIKKEAIEYFNGAFNTKWMSIKEIRQKLSKDEKERVVAFMKKRLEYYNENGFLLPK